MMGKNIYELRKKKGLTLSELAERASISKSNLSNIERNLNKNPSIQVIEKIASVLDVELKVLIGEENSCVEDMVLADEWAQFVDKLIDSGVDTEQIQEYKTLIEFIQWKNKKQEQKL